MTPLVPWLGNIQHALNIIRCLSWCLTEARLLND